jgi:hypothetical protein
MALSGIAAQKTYMWMCVCVSRAQLMAMVSFKKPYTIYNTPVSRHTHVAVTQLQRQTAIVFILRLNDPYPAYIKATSSLSKTAVAGSPNPPTCPRMTLSLTTYR